jgi:branched-chain amino acid transport system ATP-binding protein
MSAPVLEMRNVETYYGPIMAIRGVSLHVDEGEIVTVLGANGAGKTTLLKTACGALDSNKGQVLFEGRQIQCKDPDWVARQGIAHVPEGREVFPFLTVSENLMMGAYNRHDKSAVDKDVETVRNYFPAIRKMGNKMACYLSGGQQQMLAIARGFMARPKLLQNANVALRVSARGYVMEVGGMVMDGTSDQLLESEDVKEFYLGKKDEGVRGRRRWKKRKTWR